MNYLYAVLLGIIEGITEWLPISSTGHLILANEFIQMEAEAAFLEMFDVVIQFGAILAVVVVFWHKLWPFCYRPEHRGFIDRWCRRDVWEMWFHVLAAIVPSAVIGLPLDDWMTEHLHNPPVVSAMLILYGVFFIIMEHTVGLHRPAEIKAVHIADGARPAGVQQKVAAEHGKPHAVPDQHGTLKVFPFNKRMHGSGKKIHGIDAIVRFRAAPVPGQVQSRDTVFGSKGRKLMAPECRIDPQAVNENERRSPLFARNLIPGFQALHIKTPPDRLHHRALLPLRC